MCPTSFLKCSTIFVKKSETKVLIDRWSRRHPFEEGTAPSNKGRLRRCQHTELKIKMFYACRHLFPSVRRCPEFSPTRNLHSRPYITLKKIPTVLLFLKLNVKGITVLVFDDVGWDLYEEGVQFALVPLREDPAHLIVVQVKGILK